MVFFQGLPDCHRQHGCEDNGDHRVENGGGNLAVNSQHGCVGSQAVLEDAAPVVGLGKISGSVCQSTGGCGNARLDDAPVILPQQHHQSGEETIGALRQEGDPGFGNIHGIGHVIQKGAETGSQTAQPGAQKNTGQGAHDIAQVEGCGSGDVNGNGDPNGGTNDGQSSHKGRQYDFLSGDGLFVFHGKNLLA